jgi:hypothetical protein
MTISKHAERRLQQRAIPGIVLEWLLNYGAHIQQNGSEVIIFDKQSRRGLQRYLGRIYGRIEGFLDAYAVMSPDGTVITVGHRHERINCS